jgi:8-oxo-dGTP diphosphatase
MQAEEERHDDTVYAAGCVLWRRTRTGVELCLVHRPRYDDWSHPKGKLKPGEATLTAALREVLEETGHYCVPGVPLGTLRYIARERPKQVDYWAAEESGGSFAPNDEVDRVLWLSPAAARERLTRPQDRVLVDALLQALHTA